MIPQLYIHIMHACHDDGTNLATVAMIGYVNSNDSHVKLVLCMKEWVNSITTMLDASTRTLIGRERE